MVATGVFVIVGINLLAGGYDNSQPRKMKGPALADSYPTPYFALSIVLLLVATVFVGEYSGDVTRRLRCWHDTCSGRDPSDRALERAWTTASRIMRL